MAKFLKICNNYLVLIAVATNISCAYMPGYCMCVSFTTPTPVMCVPLKTFLDIDRIIKREKNTDEMIFYVFLIVTNRP